MPEFAEPLARLIQECKRLPGIGQKSAQRIAFHLLRAPREDAEALAQAVLDIKDKLGMCAQCNNISDGELCLYCRDPHREQDQICVVEEPHNILPIETTHTFRGLYHVLHGAISPLRGIISPAKNAPNSACIPIHSVAAPDAMANRIRKASAPDPSGFSRNQPFHARRATGRTSNSIAASDAANKAAVLRNVLQ